MHQSKVNGLALFARQILRLLLPVLLLVAQPRARAESHDHEGADDEHAETDGGHNRGGREAGRKDKSGSELEDVMEEMNGAFRKLRRQVDDQTQNAASLALVERMRALAQRAALLSPRMMTQAPEKDRAGLLASYREQMQELMATFTDLQAALKAGKNSKAADIVEDLRELEKAGHHKFRTDEDH